MKDNEFTRGDMIICHKNSKHSSYPLEIGGVYQVRASSRYFIAIGTNWYDYKNFESVSEHRIKMIDEILK